MTEDELKQFEALAKKYERGKDKDTVLKVLQSDMHEVFQEVNDRGRSAANEANKSKLESAEAAKAAAEQKATTLQQQLEKLNGQAPDAAKLRADFDREVEQLRKEHTTKEQGLTAQLLAERLTNAKAKLVDALHKRGVDRDYADTVLAQKDEFKSRLTFDKEGRAGVLKAGSTEITIVASDDKTPFDHLAEELIPKVDSKWLDSKVQRGSGMKTGGGTTTSNRKEKYEAIRKKEAGEDKGARNERAGLQRLGRRAAR